VDTTAVLDVAGVVGLAAAAVVAATWLEHLLHVGRPQPARELVRADGRPDATPAEAFAHAEGATAWTR